MIADDRRSQTIADDRKKGCFHIIATIAEPTVAIRFGQRKCQIYTRAHWLKSIQHGGRRRGNFAVSELISPVCHEAGKFNFWPIFSQQLAVLFLSLKSLLL